LSFEHHLRTSSEKNRGDEKAHDHHSTRRGSVHHFGRIYLPVWEMPTDPRFSLMKRDY
jgi:hypothetical protein